MFEHFGRGLSLSTQKNGNFSKMHMKSLYIYKHDQKDIQSIENRTIYFIITDILYCTIFRFHILTSDYELRLTCLYNNNLFSNYYSTGINPTITKCFH